MEILGMQIDVVLAILMLVAVVLAYPLTTSKWAAILGLIAWCSSIFSEGAASNVSSFFGMLLWGPVLVGVDFKKLKNQAC